MGTLAVVLALAALAGALIMRLAGAGDNFWSAEPPEPGPDEPGGHEPGRLEDAGEEAVGADGGGAEGCESEGE